MTTNAVFGPGFAGLSPSDKLGHAARELEAVVIAQLFAAMRGTVPEGGLLERSAAEDMFRSMLDDELARVVSEQSPFGLAEKVSRQLGKSVAAAPEATRAEAAATSPAAAPAARRSWRA